MSKYHSLQHVFLIAMPQLTDTFFSQSVIYLWEYNEQGATGIIINKPMNFQLGEVLKQLNIPVEDERANHCLVLQGGPVAIDQGFIIRRRHSTFDQEGKLTVEVTISSSKQDLINMAKGEGLNDCLVALGCTGWSAGQLDRELTKNNWLVVPFNETTLFGMLTENISPESTFLKWHDAAANAGVDLSRLIPDAGHA